MLYHYYYKRLHLFKIPYKVLLAYHCPLGNTIKLWAKFHMNQFILAIRNDVNILNIAYTIVQIRKALNAIFQRLKYKGSFTIYASALKALKMNHGSVYSFITAWIPGIISNYARVTKSIMSYKRYIAHAQHLAKRPQMEAVIATNINPFPKASSLQEKRKVPFIPRLPSISLSVLDSDIWLNECNCLGIPSIQICDTQSNFEKITYPIISNQRSMNFSYLIVYLAAEVCNTSLINSHLEFLSFYKYHGSKMLSFNLKPSKIIPPICMIRDVFNTRYDEKGEDFDSRHRYWLHQLFYQPTVKKVTNIARRYVFHLKRKSPWLKRLVRKYKPQGGLLFPPNPLIRPKAAKSLILNKQTYIFNNRNFTYQIKDLINNAPSNIQFGTSKQYYKMIHHYLWVSIQYLKRINNHLSLLGDKARKRKFYRKYGDLLRSVRHAYHYIIVYNLSLKTALSRKKRENRRFITMISFNKRDIKSLTVCSFLLSQGTKFEFLKNIENKLNIQLI